MTVSKHTSPTIFLLKGQCHEIFDHFFALKIRPGPHIIRRKRFREFFCFHEDIRLQSSKTAGLHSHGHWTTLTRFFSLDKEVFIFLN